MVLAVSDDTPNIRLEQDGTHESFEQYSWEISANEAVFSILDILLNAKVLLVIFYLHLQTIIKL